MCGIAGYVSDRSPKELGDRVRIMTAALALRGPDCDGLELWPEAAFGHRRLSIIDLTSAGNQPMISADRQIGVVLNGCIYNHLDLRRELEGEGFRFNSRCDTEVLLHGYRAWGISRLARRLQGMFAFGVWDARDRRLSLVRDRLGVKPLLYAAQPGGVAFASTASALHDAGFAGEIDPEAVLEVFEFGWPTDNRCIFKGIEKLPPATILTWKGGSVKTERYWSPAQISASAPGFEDALDQTEALLLDAVRLRLQADVPIGALLSGGIDSALVCWALKRLGSDVRAYTVGTEGEASDETADSIETARILGIEHQVVQLTRDRATSIDSLTAAFGEPFACTSALGMLRVSAAVRPYAKVLLTGDGGDDFFLGYPHHKHMELAQRIARSLPRYAPAIWRAIRPIVDAVPALRRPKHLLDYATGGLGAITRTHDGLPFLERKKLLGRRLLSQTISSRRIPLSLGSARNLMDELVSYDLATVFRGEYLPKVDGTTLACGVEARSPFLDYRLAELALSLPVETRLQSGHLKSILRELVRRNLGNLVADRPKRGFTVPVERWLAMSWQSSLEELGPDSLMAKQGWVNGESLRQFLHDSHTADRVPKQIWHLLVFERWLARYESVRALTTAPSHFEVA